MTFSSIFHNNTIPHQPPLTREEDFQNYILSLKVLKYGSNEILLMNNLSLYCEHLGFWPMSKTETLLEPMFYFRKT